jgi:formylglycine-generating enzyme required for sulfatase activity
LHFPSTRRPPLVGTSFVRSSHTNCLRSRRFREPNREPHPTATSASVAHCGRCGLACGARESCVAGRCEPPPCPEGMRLIPAGEFDMGAADISDAGPVHRVRLSAFCVDETEVTVSAYAQCPTGMGCAAPDTAVNCNWSAAGPVVGREQHPINCVSLSAALAYCRFRGGTLPSEAQWEYAARGADGRLYPWGILPFPSTQLCWSGSSARTSSCAVRSYPAGNSATGIADMAGNVLEWVFDGYGPYPANSVTPPLDPTGPAVAISGVARGGGWRSVDRAGVRASFRYRASRSPADDVGFRCTHSVR